MYNNNLLTCTLFFPIISNFSKLLKNLYLIKPERKIENIFFKLKKR